MTTNELKERIEKIRKQTNNVVDIDVYSNPQEDFIILSDKNSEESDYIFYLDNSSEKLKERIIMDEVVTHLLDKDKLVDFLVENIDENSLMVCDKIAFIWDGNTDSIDNEEESSVRNQLADEFGDEYAYEIGLDNMGIYWVERQIAIINLSGIASVCRDKLYAEEAFSHEILSTICHELRHAVYESNILCTSVESKEYPRKYSDEEHVEIYGREKSNELFGKWVKNVEKWKNEDELFLRRNAFISADKSFNYNIEKTIKKELNKDNDEYER